MSKGLDKLSQLNKLLGGIDTDLFRPTKNNGAEDSIKNKSKNRNKIQQNNKRKS